MEIATRSLVECHRLQFAYDPVAEHLAANALAQAPGTAVGFKARRKESNMSVYSFHDDSYERSRPLGQPALTLDRRTALARLLAVAVISGLPSLVQGAEAVGAVDQAQGRSTGLLNGSLRVMQIRSDVFLSEQVQTYRQARLGMVLGSRQSGRTVVRLGELTRLVIERDIVEQGGVLRLERGAMLFDRSRSGDDGHPEVWTPLAFIVARGTRFFVGPSGGVIGVFAERGIVDVINRAGQVTLVAGEGTNLKSQDIPPTTPVRWGAPPHRRRNGQRALAPFRAA